MVANIKRLLKEKISIENHIALEFMKMSRECEYRLEKETKGYVRYYNCYHALYPSNRLDIAPCHIGQCPKVNEK